MNDGTRVRRRSLIAGAAALALAPRRSFGQSDYPNRIIRVIVPYPPGGGVDVTARVSGAAMAQFLGQNIVVENRAGAGGSIGSGAVATAAPDGYTLLMHSSAHVANQHLMANLPFHYATAFIPVSQVIRLPQVLVVPNASPAKTVRELVGIAKEKPGKLSYASPGSGTAGHLTGFLFGKKTDIDTVHVPYRGGSALMPDLIAGTIDFCFATATTAVPMVKQGQLRALAIPSARRLASLPDVPTMAEAGFAEVELDEWNGLFAPAKTPAPIVARLYDAVAFALRDATVQQRFGEIGVEPIGSNPEQFAAFIERQGELLPALIREAGVVTN